MNNPLTTFGIWARGLIQRNRNPDSGQRLWFGGKSPAGVYVDMDTALTLGAVNACVRIIAETLGVLPWHLMEKDPQTKKRRRLADERLDALLSLEPNPEMSSQTLREVLAHHALLRGNGYAEIVRDQGGRVIEIWPLPPNGIPRRRLDSDELVFEFWVAGERFWIPYTDIFHIKGLSPMGVVGYDVVSYMATTVGLGIAVEEFRSEYYANGAIFSAVLEHPKKLSQDAQDRLKKDLEDNYTGRGKRWRLKVLEEAMTLKHLSADAEQAQLLQASKMSVEDVARWFRVPPHKIASLEKATLNNVEQLGIEFLQDTMLAWITRFETEAQIKLIPRARRGRVTANMKVSALARGDLKSRMDSYRVGRQWGIWTPNHILEMEDMEPVPAEKGGDTLIIPVNMQDSRSMVYEGDQTVAGNNDDGGQQDLFPPPGGSAPQSHVQTSAHRNPLNRVLVATCQRICVREERYMGRRCTPDDDLQPWMKKQAAFAQAELWPVLADLADTMHVEAEEMNAVLSRVVGRYYHRQLEAWQKAQTAGTKLKLGELYADRIADDLVQELTARTAA